MEQLISNYNLIKEGVEEIYQRRIYTSLESSHRIVGIVGSRGVGKTTYLLNYLAKYYGNSKKALYVTADNLYFTENKIIDLVEKFVNEYGGEILCIDEIHKYPNWSQELKNIYDTYKNLKIIFSGSSMVDLTRQKHDLSRRAILKYMPGFSFREYLEYKLLQKIDPISLNDLVDPENVFREISNIPTVLGHFKEYLKFGYYPLHLELEGEVDIYEAFLGIIDKTINTDIALHYNLKTSSLPIFKKILYFVHTSPPSSINVHKLAVSLKKDDKTVAEYLDMLQQSGLLRYLLIDSYGHNLIRNAEKIYLNNSCLMYALAHNTGKQENIIGLAREAFVLSHLTDSNYKPYYTKFGDISCDGLIFEIGGKNKDYTQVRNIKNAYLAKDDFLYKTNTSMPLFLFGLLY